MRVRLWSTGRGTDRQLVVDVAIIHTTVVQARQTGLISALVRALEGVENRVIVVLLAIDLRR